jgi:hypothetical protein
MDREILLLRLAQAEQSVAESKAFVARQQRLIVESEAGRSGYCRDHSLAGQVAAATGREQERAKILDEISEAS